MGGKTRSLLCVLMIAAIVVVFQCEYVHTQASSTYAKEFYMGFMSATGGTSFTKLRLIVSTPASNAIFVVESSAGVIHTGTVSHKSPVTINVPSNLQVTNHQYSNRMKGVHIYSTVDEPIFVIAETYISFLNHGVYVAYPCVNFSNEIYEYHVISTGKPGSIFVSEFLLVGCENETTITIAPSKSIQLPDDLQRQDSLLTNINAGSMSHQLVLHEMQTLAITNSDDLTGTKIISNKPLTVISGHECANFPHSASGCEPFAVQIPPVATWGKSFLLAPFAGRSSSQTFKAISSEKNSSYVSVCGTNITKIGHKVNTFTVDTDKYCYLESTAPTLVIQLSTGVTTDSKGDPAIAMISPVDQYIHDINIIFLPTLSFPSTFVSITVAIEHFNSNSIRLDGIPISCEWQEIYDIDQNVTGYGCSKAMLYNTSGPTQHIISHSDPNGLLAVLVYGFKSAHPARGYAYLSGQNLKLSEELQAGSRVFIDLTDFPEVMELERAIESYSDPIEIPSGLLFGSEIVTTAYVNENGVISFKKPWKYAYPDRLPIEHFHARHGLAIAPFWSDNDIRKAGAVRYVTYRLQRNDTTSPGKRLLDQVNQNIQKTDESFTGKWLLIVHWDHVHPSPHGDDNHSGIPASQLHKTNNYQAIIVTNVTRTYAIFTYICGDMQWSSVGENKAAVVGYNAKADFFYNHPQSGTKYIATAVSCSELGRRQKRNEHENNNNFSSNTIELPSNGNDSVMFVLNLAQRCQTMIDNDPEFRVNEAVSHLDPCPDTLDKAEADMGRFVRQTNTTIPCYVSGRVIIFDGVSLTQQCCYDNETEYLITDDQQGSLPGSLLLQHPIYDPDSYARGDKLLKEYCCLPDTLAEGISKCNDYAAIRPTNNGANYQSPDLATGSGDPHYWTFDALYYTFTAAGDFIIMEALDDSDTVVFTLQGRLYDIPPWQPSWHKALAFGHSNCAFHLRSDYGFSVFKTKPGPPLNITNQLENEKPWFNSTEQVMLLREGDMLTASFYEYGIVLIVNVFSLNVGDPVNDFMNFQLLVPKTFAGKTRGFLGNLDQCSDNDLYRRGDNTSPISVGNLDPLQTWNVSVNESLFRDPVNPESDQKRKRRQTDKHVVSFNELTFTDEQIALCEGNKPCLFDLAVTNNTQVAITTKEAEENANATIKILNNFTPNISAKKSLRVNIGDELVYNLSVLDPGDNVTLSVLGGIPQGSTLEEVEEKEYIFRWILEEVTTDPLIFIANDSLGASSTFALIIHICACVNDGYCSLSGPVAGSTTIIMNCDCNEAFSGRFCEEDRNGCSEIQCFDGVECMDVPAPGIGAVCGACPLGYTGDGLNKCYDIDECLNATICEHNCNNTDGSFICSCLPGYRLTGHDGRCQDINECEEVNDCQQTCSNMKGSYSCGCNEGFGLADDGKTCTANEPCGGECSYGCAVIAGKEECFCPVGFNLSEGTKCVDKDECLNDPCSHLCTNTNGSFECFCMSGFELQEDRQSCEDIDECLEATLHSETLCDVNAQCVNKEGSFECPCVPGYEVVNNTCQRIENEPLPPPPPSATPTKGTDNSVSYTIPMLTPEDFSVKRQQLFKEITVRHINNFCSVNACQIILFSGGNRSETGLRVEAMNVAIPSSLIVKVEGGLQLTLYVQLSEGFLLRELLQHAVEKGEEQYRDLFFPSTTTATTAIPTTTESTTTETPTVTTIAPITEVPTTESPTTVTTAPTTTGIAVESSCVAAGFNGCCEPYNHQRCHLVGCWCDRHCLAHGDCCEDIDLIGCSPT